MRDIFKGIVVGFTGFVIWAMFSVFEGVSVVGGSGGNPVFEGLVFLGFFIMVGGPTIYIVVIPVMNWWRQHRSRGASRMTSV